MSYILDALKKSEQERGHGSIPGVQTVHSSSINYHHEKTHGAPVDQQVNDISELLHLVVH